MSLAYSELLCVCVKRHQHGGADGREVLLHRFKLQNLNMAKRLWRLAVEHHAFFRFLLRLQAFANVCLRITVNYQLSRQALLETCIASALATDQPTCSCRPMPFASDLSVRINDIFKVYRVAHKSKPLPNFQKIVLNRIKAC